MTYGLKYLRPINDIHLDWDVAVKNGMPWKPKGLPTDHLTALILSGDIWHSRKFLDYAGQSWLAKRAQSFRYIIVVLGNHDYWGGAINLEPQKVKDEIKAQGLTNVFLLENDSMVLEGVKFVGGTLWTDFNGQDPLTKFSAPNIMVPDYSKIKRGIYYTGADGTVKANYTRLKVEDVLNTHLKTRGFIFENAVLEDKVRKLVVVTHMAPSELSIHESYKNPQNKITNGYYFTELGNQIAYTDIDYWFHGHTHHASDYVIGKTRVINNPRGYSGYDHDTGFREELLIEL